MIHTDRNALLCDMAETYGVYDLRALPVETVATLAAGLGADSRIKRKMRGERYSNIEILLAIVIDRLNGLIWQNSADGHKGRNRPASLLAEMLGEANKNKRTVRAFDTPADFFAEYRRITKGGA